MSDRENPQAINVDGLRPGPLGDGVAPACVPEPSPRWARQARSWLTDSPAVGVFVATVACYMVNLRPITQVDTVPPPYAAWALVRYGSFDLSNFSEDREVARQLGRAIVPLPDGRWVSKFPPGSTLMTVPVIAPVAVWRAEPLSAGSMRHLGKLAGALWTALAVTLLWRWMRVYTPRGAAPAAVLLAVGSGAWPVAGQAIWPHGPAMACLAVTMVVLWRTGPLPVIAALGAGLAFGLGVLCRPSVALFGAAALIGLMLWGQWRALGGLVLGGLPAVMFAAVYTRTYANSLETAGYDALMLYSTPWSIGLPGLLISPARGLLTHSPGYALAVVGLIALWAKREAVLATLDGRLRSQVLWATGAVGVSVLVYARWFEWWGGWCWGPRFLLECLPALTVLVAVGWQILPRWGRTVAWGLVGLSVAIQAVGVFGHPRREADGWHMRRLSYPVRAEALFDWGDSPLRDHAARLLRQRP